MATSSERIAELEARIAELEAALSAAKAEKPGGLSGWLVRVANERYSGNTAGVVFRNGRAFIAKDAAGEGEKKAREMERDFGYDVQFVEDWQSMEEADRSQVSRSLIDVVSAPEVR